MNNKVTYWLTAFVLLMSVTACQRSDNHAGNKELMVDNKLSDTIKKLDSLSGIHWINNDSLSMAYARTALKLAQSYSSENQLIIAWHAMGKAYYLTHKDSSFYYYNSALNEVNRLKDFKEKPSLLFNIALLTFTAGNYKNALELLDSCSIWSTKMLNYAVLSDANNSMGNVFMEIHDTSRAIKSFKMALQIGKQYSLAKQTGNALANLAIFEKNLNKAISLQNAAITYINKQAGTEEEIATIYLNIGTEQTNTDSAMVYYNRALNESKMGNLPLIELAAYNNLAYCYMDKGNINKAIECLVEKSIPIAKKNKYLNQLATLFDTYADVLLAKGEIRAAFDALRESILYQTKFNSIKKEDQIRLLASILELKNKEETIKVKESEIIQKNIQNQILKLIIVISVLITIILIFLYLGIRQKTNLKFKQQQINSARHIIELEETEKSRIGFELHDNFGYLLKVTDGFINSLKIEDEKIKEDLLGKMKELSDTVRRISHRVNLIKDDQTPLQDIISEIVNDMKFFTGINVSFYIPDQIPEFSKELKLHICRIVQELLTNASKYARNSRIQIDIVINENILLINYLDEGPGFDTDRIKGGGIGIGSIYERISLLGGNVKLDSSVGHETKWRITIPI